MNFESTIKEIISSIKQREFLNEAEVTNGIVMRILNSLRWNVFDTTKVKPQYGIEGKKIDFALCYPDNKPIVIIEVKALGKAVNTDEQVLIYSFKTGIPVAILTDGQEWHFYLPAERGSLTERRFYKLDLLEREPNEIIEILNGYLGYEAIRDGSAFKKAKSDYDKQYKNKEINSSIPTAWHKLIQDKDNTLVKLIAEKVADLCGYEPTEETIIDFLIGLNKPQDTQIEIGNQKSQKNIESTSNNRNILPDGFRGVLFNNSVFKTSRNSIGTLEAILKLAITQFPNALNKIQTQTTGRSRSLISKHKSGLYQNRPDLEKDSARQLPNGWWLGTNYSKREIITFCKIVQATIDREYGEQNIKFII
jgi:predicted type IV restriction endonuclease